MTPGVQVSSVHGFWSSQEDGHTQVPLQEQNPEHPVPQGVPAISIYYFNFLKKNKLNDIETPIEYMKTLNWNIEDLKKAKKNLIEWDSHSYKNVRSVIRKVDMAEKNHFKNCIKFWEDKLYNEN